MFTKEGPPEESGFLQSASAIRQMKYNVTEIKTFSTRTSLGIQGKYANIKAVRPIFYINTFQNSISEAGIRDLGKTIFESKFYLQFFASLTSDSLANWESLHLKEILPKLDKCNLRG